MSVILGSCGLVQHVRLAFEQKRLGSVLVQNGYRVVYLNVEATQDSIELFFDTFVSNDLSFLISQLVRAATISIDRSLDDKTFAVNVLKKTHEVNA